MVRVVSPQSPRSDYSHSSSGDDEFMDVSEQQSQKVILLHAGAEVVKSPLAVNHSIISKHYPFLPVRRRWYCQDHFSARCPNSSMESIGNDALCCHSLPRRRTVSLELSSNCSPCLHVLIQSPERSVPFPRYPWRLHRSHLAAVSSYQPCTISYLVIRPTTSSPSSTSPPTSSSTSAPFRARHNHGTTE
ncbi:hypothetical protein PV04_07930 [Phialophora macrospora]|uniref:Uncharacterized protein n=1 Tax=Phialophora macrospora TaxID=1851006 RepID=A0A0D2DUC0_9EURO|nr:hypothetical protein PV04_07930 [Phialophora macrospora]